MLFPRWLTAACLRCPAPSADVAAAAAELHGRLHAGGVGVDAPQPSDLYFRLRVATCFYVGQLGGDSAAEVLEGDAYRGAATDPLRTCAADLVRHMNSERPEDMLRIRWVLVGRCWWWKGGAGIGVLAPRLVKEGGLRVLRRGSRQPWPAGAGCRRLG